MRFSAESRGVRRALPFLITALAPIPFAVPVQAAFPGTNGKIAFAHCGNPCDIWAMNADGTNKVDLTNTPSAAEDSPAWSADGKQIVYVRDRAIWRMNADGTGQTQVVAAPPDSICAFPPCRTLGAPAWSPDGSKLVLLGLTPFLRAAGRASRAASLA